MVVIISKFLYEQTKKEVKNVKSVFRKSKRI